MRPCLALLVARALGTTAAARLAATDSAIAWQALTAANNGVIVYANDSYSVVVGGQVWLQNATTGLHLLDGWFTTAVAPAANTSTCTPLVDTDCHGGDLYYFNSTDPGICCANCTATPACGAWTLTGDTDGNAGPAAPPPWAGRCYIKTDCSGQEAYGGHTSGVKPTAVHALVRLGAEAANGTDAAPSGLGAWEGWRVRYAAGPAALGFWTTFKYYAAAAGGGGLFVFEQAFPDGVPAGAGLNVSAPANSTGGGPCAGEAEGLTARTRVGEFCSSVQASTLFPSFAAAPGANDSGVGWVTWTGRFSYAETGVGLAAGAGLARGSEGGPLVLYAPQQQNASGGGGGGGWRHAGAALVLSAFDNFKSNILGGVPRLAAARAGGSGGGGAFGVSGYVTALPAGYASSAALYFSPAAGGITDAVMGWGAALQSAHGTEHALQRDLLTTVLSYWTAFYDWYAYSNVTLYGLPQDVLVNLSASFVDPSIYGYGPDPLPVKYWQLDAYWYPNERADGNCKVNDTVWSYIFPRGLTWLSSQLQGAPLLIYNGPTCADTTYAGQWPLVYSAYWDQGWGSGVLSNVAPGSSLAFYGDLFDAGLASLAMGAFEIDFLDFNYLLFPDFTTSVSAAHEWLAGMAGAAAARGLSIQYCMALPSDFLESLLFPSVTNGRASHDYGAGGDNWRVGGASLLLAALGVAPSKDNFWTGARENNAVLNAAVAALSGGPVGFADELGKTVPAVLWPTTTRNGTLLHAGRPAAASDAQLMGALPAGADLWVASSDIALLQPTAAAAAGPATLTFYHVLAAQMGDVPAFLTARDLWPPPPAPGSGGGGAGSYGTLLWRWNDTACGDGMPGEGCTHDLLLEEATTTTAASSSSIPAATPAAAAPAAAAPAAATPAPAAAAAAAGAPVPFELWTAVPRLEPGAGAPGLTLLGEVGKYVAVSPQRFKSIALVGDSGSSSSSSSSAVTAITAALAGGPGETVHLAFVDGTGTVRVRAVVLGADGTGSAILS